MRVPKDVCDRPSRLNPKLRASLKNVKLAQDEIGWYRGLSMAQMKAAQRLSDSLRDDLNHKTATKVTKVLKRMGFDSIPAWDTLRLVMNLSRGSDLAFLWFLMEMCYKSPNPRSSYNANEQIIMSSIFWLDLGPTLKELDRWLPLPHASQADRDRAAAIRQQRQRMKRERKQERQRELARRGKEQGPLAPYFQDQQPDLGNMMRNPSRLLSACPDRPASLSELQDSQPLPSSPMYNRWFGNYTLSKSRRVVRSIISDEINSIFESFKAASLPPADVESLCTHHQHVREMEKSLKMELDLIKRRKCEELIMAKSKAEQRQRKLVVQELEEISAAYLKRFREMAARSRLATTRKHLFGGGGGGGGGRYFAKGYPFPIPETYRCDQMEEELCQRPVEMAPITLQLRRRRKRRTSPMRRAKGGAERMSRSRSQSRSRSRSRSRSSSSKSRSKSISKSKSKSPGISPRRISFSKPSPPKFKPDFRNIMVKLLRGDRPVVPNCPDLQLEPPECAKCHTYEPDFDEPEFKSSKIKDRRPSSLMQFLHLCGSAQDVRREHGSNWNQDPSSHPDHDRKFVELGPPGINFMKFDYRGLFGPCHRTRSDEEQMRLKEAFVRAIDDDVQYLSAALTGEEDVSIDTLVSREAKRVFAENVKTFHKELNKMLKIKAADEKKAEQEDQRLDFGQEFYDSENLPLMREMLRLGLQQVAKDKRYVLPTLPNVHATPYLIEWICQRYGKRYSQREYLQSYTESKADVSSRNPDKARQVAQCQRMRHIKRFADSLMQVCRIVYAAMRPQLCNPGMRGTFYTYMPAHYNDMGLSIPPIHLTTSR